MMFNFILEIRIKFPIHNAKVNQIETEVIYKRKGLNKLYNPKSDLIGARVLIWLLLAHEFGK